MDCGWRVGRWVGGWVGGVKKIMPHCGSILQVGTCQILNFAQNPSVYREGGTPHIKIDGLQVGGLMRIMPHCGSILQAGTCQILRLAEDPRWSQIG